MASQNPVAVDASVKETGQGLVVTNAASPAIMASRTTLVQAVFAGTNGQEADAMHAH